MPASKAPRNSDEQAEKIGRATARLHRLLKELGHLRALERSAATMPDARDRLTFIDNAMHEASEKTISAVEAAIPLTNRSRAACADLSSRLSATDFGEQRELVGDVVSGLGEIAAAEEAVHRGLVQIMEAQEFRDVAGQMVGRVVDAATEIESILLGMLTQYAPDVKDSLISTEGLTSGPNVKPAKDRITGQDEVDDLLASLGF